MTFYSLGVNTHTNAHLHTYVYGHPGQTNFKKPGVHLVKRYVDIVTHVCNGGFALIIGYHIGATGIISYTSYAPQARSFCMHIQ